MSVSGIGSSTSTSSMYPVVASDATSASDPTDAQSLRRSTRSQFRSDFASLLDAVKSGDMSAAQQALTAVQNDRASVATYSTQPSQGKGQFSTDLKSLFDAVQTGDQSAAQQALTQLQTDAQQQAQTRGAQGGGHGHHHHHHHSSSTADASTTNPLTTDPTNTTGASLGE
jgi:ribosomal protein S20